MDNDLQNALSGPAIMGLARLLAAVDPEEEIQVGGIAAITRLIAEAAQAGGLDDRPPAS